MKIKEERTALTYFLKGLLLLLTVCGSILVFAEIFLK